ncbi:hypothetical protein [Microtetraspora malaysiensis]|uniref:hypothetical protein n=1 Tax=Microtetraspora malaysiensis TaxID=161358 RepID=UPI003D93924D
MVLPCGANAIPWARVKAASVAMLWSSADRFTAITGQVKDPSNRECRAATNSRAVIGSPVCRKPRVLQSITTSAASSRTEPGTGPEPTGCPAASA